MIVYTIAVNEHLFDCRVILSICNMIKSSIGYTIGWNKFSFYISFMISSVHFFNFCFLGIHSGLSKFQSIAPSVSKYYVNLRQRSTSLLHHETPTSNKILLKTWKSTTTGEQVLICNVYKKCIVLTLGFYRPGW